MTIRYYIADVISRVQKIVRGVRPGAIVSLLVLAGTSASSAQVRESGTQINTVWIFVLAALSLGLLALFFVTRSRLLKRISDLEGGVEDSIIGTNQEHPATVKSVVASDKDHITDPPEEYTDDPFSPFADHSLPLRVADEIHRMRKRLSYMDEDVTGLSALKHSLKRLEDQLNDGGYEVIDLAGKKYVDGLNVEARFVPADNGSTDEIITDTIRPQVNYMGVIIQQAKVEVSKSYS